MRKVILAWAVVMSMVILRVNNGNAEIVDGYKVIATENPSRNVSIIKIMDRNAQIKFLQERAKANFLTEKEIAQEKKGIVEYTIFAKITSPIIDLVSNGGWSIVAVDNSGKVLVKRSGPDGVADRDSINDEWYNLLGCSFNKKIKGNKFKIYVVDTISNKRYGFEIIK